MDNVTSFIGGDHVASAATYDNIDPATGTVLATVARGGAAEVDAAVESATSAQRAWARTSPEHRAGVLTRLAALVREHGEELALLDSEDTGKPLGQARADATVTARYFDFYGHAIDTYYGDAIPIGEEVVAYTRREPHGVIGSVIAWNYPLQLLGRSIGPAIATGNASIVKPADETPRSAVRVAELALDAGLPAGVLNIVTGLGAEAGAAISEHPGIHHLTFIGSTAIGRRIAHAAADRVVPAMLELGGKSAQIVFPDADLDRAVPTIVRAILQNAGQTCSAGSRLLVHRDIHAQLVDAVAEEFSSTSIGRGVDDPDLGPLISRKQQDRVSGMVGAAGGRVVVGGAVPSGDGLGAGAYFEPTLIDDVDPGDTIAQEEVFGPVLVAMPFDDEAEAVAIANGTDYALLGAIWTRDVSRAHRLAAEVEAGQVYVNTYGAGGGVELPFGGSRRSGYGREKGREALDGATRTKTVVIRL